ncbi:hypothetical protein DL93DRAFT_1313553 [Clavulina sp. PMI_390]|nr:hypothetical protein DL93DRAFT_1313553 [Clavulina sp. PMI_390]
MSAATLQTAARRPGPPLRLPYSKSADSLLISSSTSPVVGWPVNALGHYQDGDAHGRLLVQQSDRYLQHPHPPHSSAISSSPEHIELSVLQSSTTTLDTDVAETANTAVLPVARSQTSTTRDSTSTSSNSLSSDKTATGRKSKSKNKASKPKAVGGGRRHVTARPSLPVLNPYDRSNTIGSSSNSSTLDVGNLESPSYYHHASSSGFPLSASPSSPDTLTRGFAVDSAEASIVVGPGGKVYTPQQLRLLYASVQPGAFVPGGGRRHHVRRTQRNLKSPSAASAAASTSPGGHNPGTTAADLASATAASTPGGPSPTSPLSSSLFKRKPYLRRPSSPSRYPNYPQGNTSNDSNESFESPALPRHSTASVPVSAPYPRLYILSFYSTLSGKLPCDHLVPAKFSPISPPPRSSFLRRPQTRPTLDHAAAWPFLSASLPPSPYLLPSTTKLIIVHSYSDSL